MLKILSGIWPIVANSNSENFANFTFVFLESQQFAFVMNKIEQELDKRYSLGLHVISFRFLVLANLSNQKKSNFYYTRFSTGKM